MRVDGGELRRGEPESIPTRARAFCRGPPGWSRVLEACDLVEEGPWGMLTQEDDVEIHALAARGWSVSAISRHTGRDRKTVRKYLAGQAPGSGASGRRVAWSRFAATSQARFDDDPHLDATVLYRELVDAGFDRSYPTLVRELRRLELRPVCLVCEHRRGRR